MGQWIDDVARALASGANRRTALKWLGAGLLGAAGASVPPAQAAAQTTCGGAIRCGTSTVVCCDPSAAKCCNQNGATGRCCSKSTACCVSGDGKVVACCTAAQFCTSTASYAACRACPTGTVRCSATLCCPQGRCPAAGGNACLTCVPQGGTCTAGGTPCCTGLACTGGTCPSCPQPQFTCRTTSGEFCCPNGGCPMTGTTCCTPAGSPCPAAGPAGCCNGFCVQQSGQSFCSGLASGEACTSANECFRIFSGTPLVQDCAPTASSASPVCCHAFGETCDSDFRCCRNLTCSGPPNQYFSNPTCACPAGTTACGTGPATRCCTAAEACDPGTGLCVA